MAFDKNGNGGYNQHATLSTPIGTFFSSDISNTGEYQMMKLSIYGEKLAFNFYKGQTGSQSKATTQFVSFDYETVVTMYKTKIEPLLVQRVSKYQQGEEYPEGIWLNLPLTFVDKETKQIRTIGNFIIKTEVSPVTQKNTVYIVYTNGADEYKVALGSGQVGTHFSGDNPGIDGFDIGDSRFWTFAELIHSLIRNWVSCLMISRQINVMMNNFKPIKSKLGIESGFKGKKQNNENYSENSYSSGPQSNSQADLVAPDTSYESDMPF